MYSKYQIIKILENCFQKRNCFSWIKLILGLIQLKYRYYNSPYLEHSCLSLTISVKYYHIQLKPLFNTILLMFFIGLTILFSPIRQHSTRNIGHNRTYAKPSQSTLSSIYNQILILYGSNTLPIKKVNL